MQRVYNYQEGRNTVPMEDRYNFDIDKLVGAGVVYVTPAIQGDPRKKTYGKWMRSPHTHLITLRNLQSAGPDSWIHKAITKTAPTTDWKDNLKEKLYDGKYNQILWSIEKLGLDPEDFLVDEKINEQFNTDRKIIKKLLWEHLLEYKKIDYTDDELRQIASKYKHKSDFRANDRMAAKRAEERGIFNDITKHMTHKGVQWTDEKLKQIISKYDNVPDFRKYDNAAYQSAYYQGKLPELIKDLERGGSRFKKIIYAYEFPDKSVYVGLTYNTTIRDWDHRTSPKSQVFKHIQETKEEPELKYLTTFVPWNEAKDLEGEFEKKYRDEGWNILNVATTGNLGRTIQIFTDEKVRDDASKSKSLKDFRDNFPGSYRAAQKRGKEYFFDVTKNLNRDKYSFSDEELEMIAAFYDTKKDFETYDRNAYRQATNRPKEFYNRITSHMKKGK